MQNQEIGKGAKMELEETSCPICQGARANPLHREGSFQMVKCLSCHFIYLNPRPIGESLFCFYQDYLPDDGSSIESWKKMMRPVFQRSVRLITRYKEKGKLLDVGTGFGFFLSDMRNQGWEVEGVEISEKGMDYGRKTLNLRIHPGPLEEVGFPENEFDVITAFYVIEHLSNPMLFLKECYRILKPRGLLLLRYPHTTPIKNLLRALGIQNRLYDLPAHLSDFSPGMLEKCLERVGYSRCQHWIGGCTLPEGLGKRIATSLFGGFAEILYGLSLKTFLLPGVSKSVIAIK